MGIELEVTLTDRDELNFDKSLPHCNVKKKICPKASLNLTVDIILDTVLLDCKKSPPCETYLFNFYQGKIMYL